MEYSQDMRDTGRFSMPLCRRSVNTDISEDFVLPDYHPEIRRVLCVRESLQPPSKFVGGNKLDVNGNVDYTLVYVGGDGKLCTAPLTAEYSFALPLDDVGDFDFGEGVGIVVNTVCESSNVRVSAPRRLRISSKLRTDVGAYAKRICEREYEGIINADSVQYLGDEAECADILFECSDAITLEDEYTLPDADCRVVSADGTLNIASSHIDGELIRLNGDVLIKLMIASGESGNEKCEKVVRKLPFEVECETLGVELTDARACCAKGSVTDLTLKVEEGQVAIEASIVCELLAAQNKKVSYTKDIYSTEQSVESVTRTLAVPVVLENKNVTFSQNEKLNCTELEIPANAETVDVWGNAIIDSTSLEDGKYILAGNCKYNILTKSDGEYSNTSVNIPFKYECDAGDISPDTEVSALYKNAEVISARARCDGSFLSIDSEIAICCSLVCDKNVELVESAVFSEPLEDGHGELTVCYLQQGDTLWEIAKRYSVEQSKIRGDIENARFVLVER